MPRFPKGEKRPADVIGNAVHVMRIATGEAEEESPKASNRAKGGLRGGKARAEVLSPQQRQEIARRAAKTRWSSSRVAKEAAGAGQGKKERQ
jgi:hypothetical protein